MTGFRLPTGGRIDRSRPIDFRFDGRTYSGFAGDTLASALMANGVRLVGRSFKYHRPRGIVGWGVEEPNALVTIGEGAAAVPNLQATMVDLVPGLVARSQNRWPSLGFDLMAATGLFARFLGAGFYYKTFMGPTRGAWMAYEPHIRRAAGLGKASRDPDPAEYEIVHEHTDVLVVGAGPAGMAAALAAADAGSDTLLVEQMAEPGGQLLASCAGSAEDTWRRAALDQAAAPNLRLLTRTTAIGLYDGNVVGLLERVGGTGALVRERLRIVRPGRVVLATGAIERPMLFADNDRPGVMLAGAVRHFVNHAAVAPGRRVLVATDNDSAYPLAFDLAAAGVEVVLADRRERPPDALVERAAAAGIDLRRAATPRAVSGRRGVRGIEIRGPDGTVHVACDTVACAGGWTPVVHLASHRGAKPVFDAALDAFVPGPPEDGIACIGAMMGVYDTAEAIAQGERAGLAAAGRAARRARSRLPAVSALAGGDVASPSGLPVLPAGADAATVFLDQQNDVTAKDVIQAQAEGYRSPEHTKRYTTLGMATDQGKTSNINALKVIAEARGETFGVMATTTFRPPYTPLTLGALAGRNVGRNKLPERLTPMHDWHLAKGARMIETGLWMRPWFYRWAGAEVGAAYVGEMMQVRERCGIADISTLGKIDVVGPDAAEFLNRVYVNGWKGLAVGRARYGLMLREDGIVFDDGTTSRLAEDRYFMTTTTANAGPVLNHLEFYLEAVWPELAVHVTSVSDQWAAMAVAGPRSRAVLRAAFADLDVSNAALPHMGVLEGAADGMPLRILRLSFSGERAYEVYTPAGFGLAIWERLIAAGAPFDLKPYGIEAMGGLRIEKGHVAGPELDGRTTLRDLGLERMGSTKKPYLGDVMARRPHLTDTRRPRLVGLDPIDPAKRPRGGAILFFEDEMIAGHGRGHVTSVTYSPTLGRHVALGLIEGGAEAHGRIAVASYPVKEEFALVRVVDPVFLDKEGKRLAD
ncbi:MAG: sarcosine oxidase subunit alpha family protein [Azospirillaceae bacterium]